MNEYQARMPHGTPCGPWTTDFVFTQENHRFDGATLWCRQSETKEEAAVRRMAALDDWHDKDGVAQISVATPSGMETMSEFADRLCPPPPSTETQVDWDTLEPVPEVPVFDLGGGVWIAGVSASEWGVDADASSLKRLIGPIPDGLPTAAIGITAADALANLAKFKARK